MSSGEMDKKARIAQKVREEILQTEKTYVDQLKMLIDSYISPLRRLCSDARNAGKQPPLESKEMSTMFGNIETIFQVNTHFLTELEKGQNADSSKGIGAIFLEFAPYFKMYTDYVGNHDRATDLLNKISKAGRKYYTFTKFKDSKEKTGARLAALLILPIQRVPRYRLLLQELLKRSEPASPDYPDLTKALELIKKSASHINEAVKRMDRSREVRAVQEKFVAGTEFVKPSRQFIKEGQCAKLSDGNRYRQKYQFFLFNDLFLYADFSKLTKKHRVHWKSDINADFALLNRPNAENSRYKYQFEIKTPKKNFVMVFKDDKEKHSWMTSIIKCVEERKNALDWIPRQSIGNISIDSKPQRPPRPSEDSVRRLFELHEALESAKRLVEERMNSPPSSAALVMFDYEGQDEGELSMTAGDTVEVLSMESQHGPEWWMGEINGREGIFPSNYVRMFQRCWFKATAAYSPDSETELALKLDEIVKVTKMSTGGWWYARNMATGEVGWIPANYVEECEENFKPKSTLSMRLGTNRSKSFGGGGSNLNTPRMGERKRKKTTKNLTFSAKTISILTNFFMMRPAKTELMQKGILQGDAKLLDVKSNGSKAITKSAVLLRGRSDTSPATCASPSSATTPKASLTPTSRMSNATSTAGTPKAGHISSSSTDASSLARQITSPSLTAHTPELRSRPPPQIVKTQVTPPPIPSETETPEETKDSIVKQKAEVKSAKKGRPPGPPPSTSSKIPTAPPLNVKPSEAKGVSAMMKEAKKRFETKSRPPPPFPAGTRARSQTRQSPKTFKARGFATTRPKSASTSGRKSASILAKQKAVFGALKFKPPAHKNPINNKGKDSSKGSHRRATTTAVTSSSRPRPPMPKNIGGRSPPPPPPGGRRRAQTTIDSKRKGGLPPPPPRPTR